MRETKYAVKTTTKFKKDLRLAKRRGLDVSLLKEAISILATGGALPERYRDHALTGNLSGFRECHILPVYLMEEDVLVLTLVRTGTHSDLFGK